MLDVVIGIVNKDNKLLMIKRVKKEGNLEWSFPGGKVEPFETKEIACIREVYEETGINVSIIKLLGERINSDKKIKLTYYLCKYLSGDIKILNKNEIQDIAFKNKEELERDIKTNIFEPVKKYILKDIK